MNAAPELFASWEPPSHCVFGPRRDKGLRRLGSGNLNDPPA